MAPSWPPWCRATPMSPTPQASPPAPCSSPRGRSGARTRGRNWWRFRPPRSALTNHVIASGANQSRLSARERPGLPRRRLREKVGALFGLCDSALQSRKLTLQLALDIADLHLDHAIVAAFEPRPPRGAVLRDRLRLALVDQLDREPVHEGDEVGDVPADRRLALEVAGKAAVSGQGLPEHPLGIGRVAPEQAREPSHWAALMRRHASPVLGQQRP